MISSVDSVQSSVERLPPSSGHHMYSLPEQSDTQAEDSGSFNVQLTRPLTLPNSSGFEKMFMTFANSFGFR